MSQSVSDIIECRAAASQLKIECINHTGPEAKAIMRPTRKKDQKIVV